MNLTTYDDLSALHSGLGEIVDNIHRNRRPVPGQLADARARVFRVINHRLIKDADEIAEIEQYVADARTALESAGEDVGPIDKLIAGEPAAVEGAPARTPFYGTSEGTEPHGVTVEDRIAAITASAVPVITPETIGAIFVAELSKLAHPDHGVLTTDSITKAAENVVSSLTTPPNPVAVASAPDAADEAEGEEAEGEEADEEAEPNETPAEDSAEHVEPESPQSDPVSTSTEPTSGSWPPSGAWGVSTAADPQVIADRVAANAETSAQMDAIEIPPATTDVGNGAELAAPPVVQQQGDGTEV